MDSSGAVPFLPVKLPALDNTMGAWLVGTFISLLLQGVGYHQTYRYFRLYPDDPRWLKLWVILVTLVETLNTVLSMHVCYYNLVTNYFNPTILLAGPVWSLKFLPVPGSIAAVITQLFFARRVYKIDRRFRPIAIIAATLVLAFAGCYIALTGLGTDSMVDLIIMYTVSSGLIICIFNVLNVAFSVAWPDNLIYAGTSIVLTKLYSNTFLVSLNARQSLTDRGVMMIDSKQFRSAILKQTPHSNMSSNRRIEVQQHVHVSSIAHTDSTRTAIELKVVPGDLSRDDSVENLEKQPVATDAVDIV
ncbi:hypothetical protein OH76DRAFT_1479169 [Lentinus brumalis]|uniref:DUF6534 domain-containing protein n=1 Tax=Lentinus brumalis TaxID=2498619 RepID=A0A371DNL9_9APHY|nr:hypothetical protein OH76DRAFT_1479169 [Polyporus brumalis]